MDDTKPQQNELGIEPIGRLLVKFSVPSMVSLLVNSIYNMVDQIFIGQGVGFLGNAATNVAFPFVTLSLSLALLISDGCASNLSLRLGAGDRRSAEQGFGNALVLSTVAGIVIMVLGTLFLRPMLLLFGSTQTVLPYAIDYTGIMLWGIPFVSISIVISSAIRADGNPRYSMFCMLVGAIANTILDPIFIFVFNWGVKGAALATVIGQVLNFLLCIRYIPKFQHITLTREVMKLRGAVVKTVCLLGISSFINQIAIMLVQIVVNNTVTFYGAQSVYGEDIPLTCFGIVMKVNQIIMALIIGIAGGAQPIIGFNYGAEKFDRVRKTYLLAVSCASVFAVAGFLVFQITPETIIAIFGQENELYQTFAVQCFKTVLLALFLNGFQMVTAQFFQAIGKPHKAVALSLSRQILFLIPLLIFLPRMFGLDGALYAFPCADVLAFLLAFTFILFEIRLLSRQHSEQQKALGNES